jgi:hypothetical protein
LNPKVRRVIAKLFVPGKENRRGHSRAHAVTARILTLDEAEVANMAAIVSRHCDDIAYEAEVTEHLTADRRALIGAYFTHEYSPEPLLTPTAEERDGCVPNVVYTCGALLHDGVLTIQHGISDGAIGFAQIELDELLAQMVPEPR